MPRAVASLQAARTGCSSSSFTGSALLWVEASAVGSQNLLDAIGSTPGHVGYLGARRSRQSQEPERWLIGNVDAVEGQECDNERSVWKPNRLAAVAATQPICACPILDNP